MNRLMSDAEIRRRKKVQGHVSQATGALGLGALAGTLAASRGGRTTLRKIPALKDKIAAPKPLKPDRDRIKGAVTPVLATSAGLGGAGAFNFASYTGAESRKRKQAVVKSMGVEMGFYGEEGHQGVIEKAWESTASTFDSEGSRKKRSKSYESGALVGAGAAGTYAGYQGKRGVHHARKIKSAEMAPTEIKVNSQKKAYKVAPTANALQALPKEPVMRALKHGGKAAAGAAAAGAAIGAHKAIRRKRKSSWEPYAKRDTTSAFGVDHE